MSRKHVYEDNNGEPLPYPWLINAMLCLVGGTQTLRLRAYPAAHQQNANWNFVGNPYNAKYDILGQLSKMGIESPIAVWNGTGYTTYTPGIDSYVLMPFEPFFIQVTEDRDIQLTPEHIQQ